MIFVNNIKLYIPSIDELWYRQTILMQPDTMSYNKGFDLDLPLYHKDTGCIEFPKEKWEKWYSFWIDNKPTTFYAYILRESDHQFIGEVNLHYNSKNDWYDMGIVIESKFRGKGYSKDALNLLLETAFTTYTARAVHNDFENTRDIAYKLHLSAGFKIISSNENIIDLLIKRKDY